MTFDLQTKTGKLANALVVKGEALTAAQAKKRFGLENVRSAVSRIRQTGVTITATQRKAKNGTMVTEYIASKTKATKVTKVAKVATKQVAVKAASKKAKKA